MENFTKKYLKAFNDGYLLAKHYPNLLNSILLTNSENEYITGLNDGKKVYDLEQSKSRRLQEIQDIQSRNLKDKGLER